MVWLLVLTLSPSPYIPDSFPCFWGVFGGKTYIFKDNVSIDYSKYDRGDCVLSGKLVYDSCKVLCQNCHGSDFLVGYAENYLEMGPTLRLFCKKCRTSERDFRLNIDIESVEGINLLKELQKLASDEMKERLKVVK